MNRRQDPAWLRHYTDDELDRLVERYERLAAPAPLSRQRLAQGWRRWERWCQAEGIDPYAACADEVVDYLEAKAQSRSTAMDSISSIRWQYAERGLQDPTDDPVVERAVTAAARRRPRTRRPRTAQPRALDATELIALFGTQQPDPDPLVVTRQALTIVSWHADRTWRELCGIPRDRTVIGPGGLTLPDGTTVPAQPDRRVCPVATVAAMDELLPARRRHLFASADAGRSLGSQLDRNLLRVSLLSRARTLAVEAELTATLTLRRQVDLADAERLVCALDLERARRLREDTILSLLFWGGLLPVDIARARRRDLEVRPDGGLQLTVRGPSAGTVSFLRLPEPPEADPVEHLTEWMWLTGLEPEEPLVPAVAGPGALMKSARTPMSDTSGHAYKSVNRILQQRCSQADVNRDGVTSRTGRLTFAALASAGGASELAIATHLRRCLATNADKRSPRTSNPAAHQMEVEL